ncbi:MAG: hypothetical protein FJW30_23010 [Acidobacteria bacterium]|nr:hypothetical protein [Acidobacteriota bacterium]
MPNSRIHVKFDFLFNKTDAFRPHVAVDLEKRTLVQIGGDSDGLRGLTFGTHQGREYFDVSATFPIGKKPAEVSQVQNMNCEVWLDLFGDGKSYIPQSGNTVPLELSAYGSVYSRDY